MEYVRESFFGSAFRAFLKTIAIILGVFFALFLVGMLFGLLAGGAKSVEQETKVKVLPNSKFERRVFDLQLPTILQINVEGVIGTPLFNAEQVEKVLVESREGVFKGNPIKAVLLNINSPGGTVVDSDRIYKMLLSYKSDFNIPIYAYSDSLCASGAYEISLAADKFFTSDDALVGSIGVIMPTFFNYTGLMDKVGVSAKTISEGIGKDGMNPFRPWKEGEEQHLQEITKFYYDRFMQLVVSSRPHLSKEVLEKDLGARVFVAPQAKEYGLVDEIDFSRDRVLKALAEKLDLADFQVVVLEEKNLLKELFFGSEEASMLFKVVHTLDQGKSPAVEGKMLYLHE